MKSILQAACAAVAFCGLVNAQVVVNSNISTSTTWTANNVYDITQQIYVLPGATLTIEPGTVVACSNLGSLAVCRGAQIFVNGNQFNPVTMTSAADRATWVGGNPKTGTFRQACNEWGNLTIMGAAYVSENATVGNTAVPSASNFAVMEGLVPPAGSGYADYGGGNDDDDSGSVRYLSIRYGGKVIGLNNELNGLSLGGIGRGTDIDHVEIMNNVDDGIEIWGGTVNLKYVSIWNIGDDSFDVDQGWRGKAQFGLIVQGWSVSAAQGSGVGDNSFEFDGAEQSDWQPVTTATMYNWTVIGQPFGATSGDHATAWRDGARVQYRNCVFMDTGDRVVSNDNVDGDGGAGYGFNGTLSYASLWTTPYSTTSLVNAPANPAAFYTAQTSGNLCQITDSVFFNNTSAAAYTEANNRGVFGASNNNVLATVSPITSISRTTLTTGLGGTLQMANVTSLNPAPANDALTSVAFASGDSFFTAANYRGAFGPGSASWLAGWTASEAFGLTPTNGWHDLGNGSNAGTSGAPVLSATGTHLAFAPLSWNVSMSKGPAFGLSILAVNGGTTSGGGRGDLPFAGGLLVPDLNGLITFAGFTDITGSTSWALNIPAGFPGGYAFYFQAATFDAAGPATLFGNLTVSNALSVSID
jgi:hypothetical protein